MPLWRMRRLASKVKDAISDPAGFVKEQLKLCAVDTLELCLVCEVCWRPQRGNDAYEVTTKSDFCAKVPRCTHTARPRGNALIVVPRDVCAMQVMPIAKATLYTIKAVNGLAGIAQCFLPGTVAGHRRVGGRSKRQGRALRRAHV